MHPPSSSHSLLAPASTSSQSGPGNVRPPRVRLLSPAPLTTGYRALDDSPVSHSPTSSFSSSFSSSSADQNSLNSSQLRTSATSSQIHRPRSTLPALPSPTPQSSLCRLHYIVSTLPPPLHRPRSVPRNLHERNNPLKSTSLFRSLLASPLSRVPPQLTPRKPKHRLPRRLATVVDCLSLPLPAPRLLSGGTAARRHGGTALHTSWTALLSSAASLI